MKSLKIILTFMAILVLTACSSTTINSSWKSPEYTDKISRPYIIAMMKNETERRLYEDQFRVGFTNYGVMGVTSYANLKASNETDKEKIASQVRANGADSVLMVRFLSQRTEEFVEPAKVTTYVSGPSYKRSKDRYYVPRDHYYDYGNYYTRSYQTIYEPATVTDFNVDTLEANLYDAKSQQMVWSAQLEIFEDAPKQSLVQDFINKVLKDLQAKGLI